MGTGGKGKNGASGSGEGGENLEGDGSGASFVKKVVVQPAVLPLDSQLESGIPDPVGPDPKSDDSLLKLNVEVVLPKEGDYDFLVDDMEGGDEETEGGEATTTVITGNPSTQEGKNIGSVLEETVVNTLALTVRLTPSLLHLLDLFPGKKRSTLESCLL